MTFPDPVQLAVPAFIIAMMLEMFMIRAGVRGGQRGQYEWRDTGTSLAMGFGNTMVAVLVGGGIVASMRWLAGFALFDIPLVWWVVPLCFVAEDFAYYWFHRTAHRVRWFWASHIIHHSSQHYNLSTALRQTWTGWLSLSFVFRMPLLLLGFPVEMVLFCAGLNLVYQFFIHTEVIDKLPFGMEGWLNSPSHHRVHHGTNPQYLDRNYGGVFIVWDRMFGTFEPEVEKPRYGIIHNLASFNPLWVAVHEWTGIARDAGRARSVGGLFRAVLGPPGAVSGETSDTIRAASASSGVRPAAVPAE
ncbi:fatty acid hydroxylase [Polymorphobacter multimanifer]|uniref:Sterol desaturase/sphingolipid hydroxylase (Fatty acid hydroxylase superfamily) n=1 Tax=Polymorphobacter multimanifer TaxID=1070431 RepID=A0A841LFX6_9SPHN|nr:sterol desaturase family protein [Polymorphobacter multimanifer]MBB6227868.1 sterol desaturase/sphingolipid hydroxylase (fatty acid hydroxylase superfamily) [Polymorphobacter multimanifer]GGI92130.1 fatty acid hydroxylase [Polymorphobacter multimanifer]